MNGIMADLPRHKNLKLCAFHMAAVFAVTVNIYGVLL